MLNIFKCVAITGLLLGILMLHACSENGEMHHSEESITASAPVVDEIPLIYHMSFISRYATKLYFAGDAENWELADIYSHEIEEISEDIVSRGEMHDGINISELMDSMLLPQIEELEEAIDNGDREMFMDRYTVMVETCNSCHVASDYGAVKVAVPQSNPFSQDFSPN